MRLYDSHAHFDGWTFTERLAVCERALAAGVTHIVAIGGCPSGNAAALELAALRPAQVRAAVGWDRAQAARDLDLGAIRKALQSPGVVAVGETGLDYHHDSCTAARQRPLFAAMLDLAAEAGLPTIVHSREAEADTLAALRDHARRWRGDPARIGVVHCFTGDSEFAAALLDLGWHISFSGIVGFANAERLRAVARCVPVDRLLVETDAPYLSPPPFRGRVNEPARLNLVVEALAAARGERPEQVTEVTFENAERLFGR